MPGLPGTYLPCGPGIIALTTGLSDLVSTAQTEAIEYDSHREAYSASMLAIDSATTSFAFIVCQLFNESTNELGLRIYSVLYPIETMSGPLGAML